MQGHVVSRDRVGDKATQRLDLGSFGLTLVHVRTERSRPASVVAIKQPSKTVASTKSLVKVKLFDKRMSVVSFGVSFLG